MMLKRAILGAAALAAATLLGPAGASAQVSLFETGDSYFIDVRSLRDIPFRTVVRQQYDYSCGSAALATLLSHHYGKPVSESAIFRTMYEVGDQEKIRKVGFSLLDMKRYLEAQGYQANGYRLTLTQLETSKAPAITVIQIGAYKHFVVIKGVRDGKVLIGDPALGLKTYTYDEFEKLWNGIVFVILEADGQQVAFNREDEWRPWTSAPLDGRFGERSMAAFDRQLRPIYQLTPPAVLQAGVSP